MKEPNLNGTLPVIDGIGAERAETPASIAELSETLKQAGSAGTTMIPVGGGTKLHIGNPPRSAGLAVRTCRLRGITGYEPDNMTVSALAGTPLEELQDAVRDNSQFLPLDPPNPESATLGGLVACNTSGPIRFRYGTIRDLLIGIRIVHADGTATKAGGKLVKNVTGYDMCKLYTGSLGTLGVFAELTFKLLPTSESLTTMVLSYPSPEEALAATRAILGAGLLPDAIETWNSEAFSILTGRSDAPWVVLVRFGEVEEAVRWQCRRLEEIAPSTRGEILRVSGAEDSERFWRRAASARESDRQAGTALVKCSVLYRSAAATARRIEETGRALGARASVFCHAGNSVLYGRFDWAGSVPGGEGLRSHLASLRDHCRAAGGHAVIERVPPGMKSGIDVWGYDAPALSIMRRIKQEFDPKSLLNPGRFVGGI